MKSPKILLIVSCSKKKAEELQNQKMKAEDAYRGPIFQVINKAKREGRWGDNISLGIISAKYGFIRGNEIIEDYDQRINNKLAQEFNPSVIEKVLEWQNEEEFDLIYGLMGKDYLITIDGLDEKISTDLKIENMGGTGIGQKKLLNFLNEHQRKSKSILDYI